MITKSYEYFCNECGYSEVLQEYKSSKWIFCPKCGHVNTGFRSLKLDITYSMKLETMRYNTDNLKDITKEKLYKYFCEVFDTLREYENKYKNDI